MRAPLAVCFCFAGLSISKVAFSSSDAPNMGTHYSPLVKITPQNVSRLTRAWTYHTKETGRQLETEPLIADGVLYITTENSRVVALDSETGKEIWKFDPNVTHPRENRGVSYWRGDANHSPRVFLGTGDGKLIALNAKTGHCETEFGDNGILNLRLGMADAFPKASYAITSPPAIYRNLVIVGPSTQEGPSLGPSSDPRAFDARTGKSVWRFHTVPWPAEAGNETWGEDGWKNRAGPSLWGEITVDTENGLVFLPTGNPADSFYGADRKGTNLYANCLIALDAETGKLRWYFQMVHHDIFDYDVTGAPALITAVKNGKSVPAVAEITKMGLLFILDRVTGEPVFGVEERRVPSSGVPGEQTWPTQPFPLKPPPLGRISIDREDLSTRTPEAETYCKEQFDKYVHGDLYTPFGLKPTLVFPGAMGGGNWGGLSFDPQLGYVFVNTSNMGGIGHMVPSAPGSPVAYRNESAYARFLDQDQYPCQQPPWGLLNAVNANTGEIVWQVPLGGFEELEKESYRHGGTPNVGGSIATASGLVFIGATNDARFRAFDSRTGKELWVAKLDATANSSPVTYEGKDGRQYVVVAAGGPDHLRNVGDNSKNVSDAVIAFALSSGQSSNIESPGPPVEPAHPAVSARKPPVVSGNLPDGEGKSTVVLVCSKCHGVETFLKSRMSRRNWQLVVSDMVQRGATGTDAQMRTIVNYLAKYLGNE